MEFQKFFFVHRPKDPSRQRRLDYVATFISFRDIRGQTVKVVVKRIKFWTFFALPNVKGAVPLNFVPALTPKPRAASRTKVSSGYTP